MPFFDIEHILTVQLFYIELLCSTISWYKIIYKLWQHNFLDNMLHMKKQGQNGPFPSKLTVLEVKSNSSAI